MTFEILRDALAQAREARLSILGQMHEAISAPRTELSPHAPRILTVKIDPEKIGLLIGKGGETIRALQDEYESQIDVNDEGQVLVYSRNGELGDALAERIRAMTKEVEVGDEYTGKVVKTTTFGAFVELAKGTDGLLHISNIAPGQRPATVEEVLNKGDEVSRPRGRGRPRARAHRPAPRRGPGDRRQDRRGAASVGTAAATAAARAATAGPRDRGPRGDRGDRGDRGPRGGDGGARLARLGPPAPPQRRRHATPIAARRRGPACSPSIA